MSNKGIVEELTQGVIDLKFEALKSHFDLSKGIDGKVDPYKVVDCVLDNFAPYAYIEWIKVEKYYPEVSKLHDELQDICRNDDKFGGDLDYKLSEWSSEYLDDLRG